MILFTVLGTEFLHLTGPSPFVVTFILYNLSEVILIKDPSYPLTSLDEITKSLISSRLFRSVSIYDSKIWSNPQNDMLFSTPSKIPLFLCLYCFARYNSDKVKYIKLRAVYPVSYDYLPSFPSDYLQEYQIWLVHTSKRYMTSTPLSLSFVLSPILQNSPHHRIKLNIKLF